MTAMRQTFDTRAQKTTSALLALMPNGCDHPLPETPQTYWCRGPVEATVLTSVVFDIRRRRPLLVLTPTRDHNYDVDPYILTRRLWATADVAVITDRETTRAFCAAMPAWQAVYGGAVRIFAPGADIADGDARHALFKPYPRDVELRLNQLVGAAQWSAKTRLGDPVVLLDTETRAHQATRDELIRVRADLADLRAGLDSEDDNDRPVYSDPEVQFEHDLHLAWLGAVPESDRETWSLARDYEFGPEFLASVDALQTVSRARVLRACVDVITNRYPEIPGRAAHRVLVNPGGTGPVQTREDGAVAWRCAVQTRGKAAARLMWWERPDGGVELSRVAEHDDCRVA